MIGYALRERVRARHLANTGEARALRQRAGVTLAELAEACGVTAMTIHRWETGQRAPRGDRALLYLAALDAIAAALTANTANPQPWATTPAGTGAGL